VLRARRRGPATTAPLSDAEEARLARLIDGKDGAAS